MALSGALFGGREAEVLQNRAECSIRPYITGWKNWSFSNTPAGTQSSAVIYNLIATAKENDWDPYCYLVWLLNNASGLNQTDDAWAGSFLPVNAPQKVKFPNRNENADHQLNTH